jgi:hypothetical protein
VGHGSSNEEEEEEKKIEVKTSKKKLLIRRAANRSRALMGLKGGTDFFVREVS